MRKYEKINCPHCMTEMHISRIHRNNAIKCLCGKKLMVISIDGKYSLEVIGDGEN